MDNVSDYIVSLFAAEDRLLASLREEADRTGMPTGAISPDTGRLLQVLMRAVAARRVLEVGTLGGYSAIWMARALPAGGHLVTIERDERHAAFAERYITQAGFAASVSVRHGRAVDVLPSLDGEEFDLVFLDADRPSLPTYFDWALRLIRHGGVIVAHNTLCGGRVAAMDVAENDDVRAVREFNQRVASDPRLTSIMIPAYDGLVIALADGLR